MGEEWTLAEPAEIDMDVRIVAVDDDPASVLLLRRMLERAGYRGVVTTTEPDKAVDLCTEAPTALLLLDLHMPGCDGYEVMSAVRQRTRDLAIVVLTGDAFDHVAERALRAGAAGVLVKPFTYDELIERVSDLVAEGVR